MLEMLRHLQMPKHRKFIILISEKRLTIYDFRYIFLFEAGRWAVSAGQVIYRLTLHAQRPTAKEEVTLYQKNI
jgi:hypothetical protein